MIHLFGSKRWSDFDFSICWRLLQLRRQLSPNTVLFFRNCWTQTLQIFHYHSILFCPTKIVKYFSFQVTSITLVWILCSWNWRNKYNQKKKNRTKQKKEKSPTIWCQLTPRVVSSDWDPKERLAQRRRRKIVGKKGIRLEFIKIYHNMRPLSKGYCLFNHVQSPNEL